MRPAARSTVTTTTPTTSPSAGLHSWSSPLPYLFGGLAAMVALIALALVVLACTRHKSAEDDDDQPCEREEKAAALRPLHTEPRIVVIMAGDDVPTFLVQPLSHLPAV